MKTQTNLHHYHGRFDELFEQPVPSAATRDYTLLTLLEARMARSLKHARPTSPERAALN